MSEDSDPAAEPAETNPSPWVTTPRLGQLSWLRQAPSPVLALNPAGGVHAGLTGLGTITSSAQIR
jgi:hypothetical protein